MLRASRIVLGLTLIIAGCRSSDGPPATYTVGGAVTGLAGSSLVLQINGGNNLTVTASGPFVFGPSLGNGSTYNVTVLTHPTSPSQTCAVASGTGTISSVNVTTIAVMCTTNSFAVGGSVSGLNGTGLVLENNGTDDLTVNANGPFSFATPVTSGGAYAVTVRAHPTGASPQRCTVSNGSGVVTTAAVISVEVACAPPTGKFLYVPNQASNDISAYAIDANTGALTGVPGSPFTAAPSPTIASVDPLGKFLYVSSRGSASSPPALSAYSINATTGELTPINGSPFALSVASPPASGQVNEIGRLLIHASGSFGYLTIPNPSGRIYGLAINPTTGVLTEVAGMPINLGHTLYTGTYATAGNFIYFPHISNGLPIGLVQSYSINQPSGVLTPVGSFDIQSRGATMAVLTPADDFLLTPNIFFGNMSVLDVDPAVGTMAPVAGSPVVLGGGAAPFAIAYHRGKDFVYVTDSTNPTVFALRLNTTTGAVSSVPGSPYTAGTGQLGPAILDPAERFLFVPQRTANAIQAYTVDQTTGALTGVAGGPFATGSSPSVAADPSGRFLFVSNAASGTVSSYSIHQTTGVLSLVNSLPAGQSPQVAEIALQ
jgi:6-phosphogluconolactonase (cycloisomerase 2 family)